jgi:hypothetical protein
MGDHSGHPFSNNTILINRKMKKAEISKITENIMGTTSFGMKLEGWRKTQDFIVYPKSRDDTDKEIQIQSSKRIGRLDLETGEGKMSASYPSGAYFAHYTLDKAFGRLEQFKLTDLDTQTIRMKVFTTAGPSVGTRHVVTDNSGAINIL